MTRRPDCPSVESLAAVLREEWPKMVLSLEDGRSSEWTSLLLAHADGLEVAAIERNVVGPGTLGADELAEFVAQVESGKPSSAIPWLTSFLSSVKTIYAFQHLSGTERGGGDEALRSISHSIWERGDAILQADGEGFSNEDGYHILWQFSEGVSGAWWMALLQSDHWVRFQMELGNPNHRRAFLEGRVPPGVRMGEQRGEQEPSR